MQRNRSCKIGRRHNQESFGGERAVILLLVLRGAKDFFGDRIQAGFFPFNVYAHRRDYI